jgi:hypothetical protein
MSDLAFREWYLNQYFEEDGMTLSERITAMDFQTAVAEEIRLNLQAGADLVKLTNAIKDYTVEEDIPQGLRELASLARQVSAGDVELFDEYNSVLNAQKAIIKQRMEEDTGTLPSKLTKSYDKLITAAETLNASGIEAAVERAIDQKAASNAFRIAITESARAYGIGMRTRVSMDPDATGITWEVSSDENNCDECLSYDGRSFALDSLPDYPAH